VLPPVEERGRVERVRPENLARRDAFPLGVGGRGTGREELRKGFVGGGVILAQCRIIAERGDEHPRAGVGDGGGDFQDGASLVVGLGEQHRRPCVMQARVDGKLRRAKSGDKFTARRVARRGGWLAGCFLGERGERRVRGGPGGKRMRRQDEQKQEKRQAMMPISVNFQVRARKALPDCRQALVSSPSRWQAWKTANVGMGTHRHF
jgi:hypothetical protein